MIKIPFHTPLGKDVTTVGIWLSGGADSAMLCYLLAEHIKRTQRGVKIQPLTIDYKRPFQNIGVQVKDKIAELLDAGDIFLDHIVYHPESEWTADELSNEFHKRNYENFKENKFQVLFSGISTNPPQQVQEGFKWGILDSVEKKRGEGVAKTTSRYFVETVDGVDYEFLEIKPFFEMNKKDIAEIYADRNLLETLFPLTRSCEKIGTVTGHCGECWWCEERQWAFKRL